MRRVFVIKLLPNASLLPVASLMPDLRPSMSDTSVMPNASFVGCAAGVRYETTRAEHTGRKTDVETSCFHMFANRDLSAQ